MKPPYPNWPILMTPDTLAAYLDCVQANGRRRQKFSWWRRRPGFPRPDPHSGMYYRPAVEAFLAEWFGYADPVEVGRRELDRRFG